MMPVLLSFANSQPPLFMKIKENIKRKLQDLRYYYYIIFGDIDVKKFMIKCVMEWDTMSISQRNCILTHTKKIITRGRKNGYKREKIS